MCSQWFQMVLLCNNICKEQDTKSNFKCSLHYVRTLSLPFFGPWASCHVVPNESLLVSHLLCPLGSLAWDWLLVVAETTSWDSNNTMHRMWFFLSKYKWMCCMQIPYIIGVQLVYIVCYWTMLPGITWWSSLVHFILLVDREAWRLNGT